MIKKHKYPILEYSTQKEGLIHAPNEFKPLDISKYCVFTFFNDVLEEWEKAKKIQVVHTIKSEGGVHKIYEIIWKNQKVCLVHPVLGGPYAGAFIEEMMAFGSSIFLACGGGGVLDKTHTVGKLLIPYEALRDEGLSYHYLPPSRTIMINPKAIDAIEKTLNEQKIAFKRVKTWTTDGFYRETKEMIAYRKEEGCEIVEMECASFASVAQFRGAIFGQILYAGDDISSETWDSRKWKNRKDIREKIVTLCLDAILNIEEGDKQ